MKKLLSLILCAVLILTVCACSRQNPENPESTTQANPGDNTVLNNGNLKLAYSKTDSLNPFECKTKINMQISKLLYDGLFTLDGNFEPQKVIAESVIVGGRTVNVTIKDAVFSDGSKITSSDIEYSFNTAKNSDNFSAILDNIVNITISSDDMVMFVLEKPDPYAASCLYFPIIKKDTAVEDADPVGSGRYQLYKDGEKSYLLVNTKRTGFNPVIKKIFLEPIHDSESAESSLVIGNTAFFYSDLSDGKFSRINAKYCNINLNNIVYMGFNPDCPFFETSEIRRAVSYALDRDRICSSGFSSHAVPAELPFNPSWYALKSLASSQSSTIEKAEELIEESGIDLKSRVLVLMYNAENGFKEETAKIIRDRLQKAGFLVNLYGVEAEYFADELRDGHYDLYIGEVKLQENMNLEPLFTGQASKGFAAGSESGEKYLSFTSGECEIMDFLNTFNSEMPFVPLCYRNAVAFYTNSMNVDFNCSENDVFYDIESWSIN